MNVIDRPLSRTLRDIASLINSGGDLGTTLLHLVKAGCYNTVWSMGGVMSIDEGSGDAVVLARHDPNRLGTLYRDRWTLATSPSLIALTTNEPVIIRDAQVASEFPGYQEEAIERGYHTVVVLPLGCRDMEGRAMVLSVKSRSIVEPSDADLAFLETIAHLGAIAVDRSNRLQAERLAAERLQNVLAAHSALMQKVLSDGSVASAAALVETFMHHPTVVVDLTANLVVTGRSPKPETFDDERWREEVNAGVNRQFLRIAREVAGNTRSEHAKLYLSVCGQHLNLPAMVEPLRVDERMVGALVVFSRGADFGDLDHLLLESAKSALSVQMMRSHLRFQTESKTASELFAEIVSGDWRNPDDLVARARRLDIDMAAPARLIAIGLLRQAGMDDSALEELHRSIARLAAQQGQTATAANLDGIILCRVPGGARDSENTAKLLVRKVIDETQWLLGCKPIVVVGRTCSGLQEHRQIWQECARMIRLGIRFNRTGLLASQDFGPFPLLLSAADTDEVRAFLNVTIGAVSRHDAEHGTGYIPTLAAYLESGCRSQACADAMGLHVTTLRYRLGRIQELFGIEIDTPERRFALELALRLNETLSQDALV